MSNLKHLTQRHTEKNDECYTKEEDIFSELSKWAELGKFKDKNIICPCDWDVVEEDNTFAIQFIFEKNNIKIIKNNVLKLTDNIYYDLWNPDLVAEDFDLKKDEIEDFLKDKLTCNFLKVFIKNAKTWGIKSVTASGYSPKTGRGVRFQDIDYSNYDICVTNPPFSLYTEFMNSILGKIDFICLAPFLNRINVSIGVPLIQKKAYLGFNVETQYFFLNPQKNNNTNLARVNCDWVTSFSEAQEERNKQQRNFKTGVRYEEHKNEFPELPYFIMKDGTHPIRVGSHTFPEDFDGWMFASIRVLSAISHDEYEWYPVNNATYFWLYMQKVISEKTEPSYALFKPDGSSHFGGILFRRKK